ncbi:MAG: glycosyltransferase family 2 protein [Candidatus Woesearchaeota archaeon]|jgi:glycosyltransferase involved in cell wall biosynthesis|nr:glycosyltransferase family 2 protein [Candidatus Woesearchaeota archaeon]|tara:strand:+ start:103 stop:765 length:663 start_codon:yes stop_codon:yes gene_type:complete
MEQDNVWAVIPAYNEEENIINVIKETKKYLSNIVVVDDGSKDRTYEVAKQEGIIVLKHIINLGKGAALKTGCDFTLKKEANKIIVLDSDNQHEPSEIPNFLNELKNKEVILGYRKRNNEMPFILKLGNFIINRITKLLYNVELHDTQCGYRAFTSDAYKKIRWKASDYSMESEMIANIGKNKLSYTQIPIKTIYVDRYKGTTIIDGIKIVLNMIWWKITK